jgi:hypothetical protein
MGREFIVTRDVVAGDELFLNYGYCKHNGDVPDWTEHIPMTGDFNQAAKITWYLVHGRQTGGVEYDPISGQIVIPIGMDKRVADLLPQTKARLTELTLAVKKRDDLPEYLAKHMGLTQRTPDWIRSHGMCMEHMVPRKSTLSQAGQGGVAQHRIRKGEMVVPVPLLQIMDKEALVLFDKQGKHIGSQLLLNYCFGHPESSEYILRPELNRPIPITHSLTPSSLFLTLGRSFALSGYERGLDQPLQQAQEGMWTEGSERRISMVFWLGSKFGRMA